MKKTIIFFGALLLSLTGCQQIEKKPHVDRVIAVSITTTDTTENVVLNSYPGTIEESKAIDLNFRYGGTIEKINVQQGQMVSAGDIIATIKSDNALSSRQSAQASLNQAEDAYKRLKKVYESGSLAEVKWIEMETNLAKAKSAAALADNMVEETVLKAPFSGKISQRNVEVGENVSPMQAVVRLMNADALTVKISVPENEIAKIKVGDAAEVVVPALENKVLTGRVVEKGLVASLLAHAYPVKIQLDDTFVDLMPGMVGKVTLQVDKHKGIVIPANIVLLSNNDKFVWIEENGKAHKCIIEVAGYSGNGVLVSNGLAAGQNIIVEGYQKVSEGMKVKPIKSL